MSGNQHQATVQAADAADTDSYSPRHANLSRPQRPSERRAAIVSVNRRNCAKAASRVICSARSSAAAVSFAFRNTSAVSMACSACCRASLRARSAAIRPCRSSSRSSSACRRPDCAVSITARSRLTSSRDVSTNPGRPSHSVVAFELDLISAAIAAVPLDTVSAAQGRGTRTRIRPSSPGCRSQRRCRMSRLAEPMLILRAAASSAFVIQTPSLIQV